MATFNKIDSFVEALAEKTHNLGSDQLAIALTNTAHTSTWAQLSDLTEIDYSKMKLFGEFSFIGVRSIPLLDDQGNQVLDDQNNLVFNFHL